MKKIIITIILLLTSGAIQTATPATSEFSGYIAAESRLFLKDPILNAQKRDSASIAVRPEYYREWDSGSSFTFVPFARFDNADKERSHFDIRELNYLHLAQNWEIRIGIGKVFWGATEFVHLVDIINQTDLVESITEEEKLGQPMIHLSIPRDWGTVDMFVLPGFRERSFPGEKGRLRSARVVDTDKTQYESSDKERHVDFAIRYSRSIGNWDIGIYNFRGTDREPLLQLGANDNGESVRIPYYSQINQTGLDLQKVTGPRLFKLEAAYRTGQEDDYFATVCGFEYTFINLKGTGIDLGIITETAYDERGSDATSGYNNDLMLGARLSLNDAQSTEILAGLIHDIDTGSSVVTLEASRRIGSNWKASIEAWIFTESNENDAFYSLRDDSHVRFELAFYF